MDKTTRKLQAIICAFIQAADTAGLYNKARDLAANMFIMGAATAAAVNGEIALYGRLIKLSDEIDAHGCGAMADILIEG